MSITVRALSKDEARARLNEIADVRIRVFRDFPYIYDGSLEYEVKYLQRYFNAENAIFIAAIDENLNGKIIGLATGLPLSEEDAFVQKPFLDLNYNLSEIFYFGESVLLPEYRGLGIGHRFFDEREKKALAIAGVDTTAFCAVQRSSDHPLRPSHYRALDDFWISRGYSKQPQLVSEFSWLDLGDEVETNKKMIYWLKNWNQTSRK